MRRAVLGLAVCALLASVGLPAAAPARVPDAVASASCAKETKRLKTFQRGMKAARKRFFRTHRGTKARKRFVRQQKRKLARLRRARKRCLARPPAVAPVPPAPAPASTPAPGPVPTATP